MTGRGRIRGAVLVVLAAAFFALPASAAGKEKTLGAFGAWRAYAYDEGGQKVCYMVTTKTVKSTGPKKRAAPYLMITHRPVEASTDVVSYGAGTILDAKHGVKLHVGKAAFELFSVRDTAWARDSLTDHKLAASLRGAPVAQASGLSVGKGGRKIADFFDLTGVVPAYQAIGKACGLPDRAAPKPAAAKKPAPRRPAKRR